MRVAAAILAAGQGTRFGGDKCLASLGGKPVWRWSYDLFANHPAIERVIVVGSKANFEDLAKAGVEVVLGGLCRQESSLAALKAVAGFDALLIHDAARPFASMAVIDRVLEGIRTAGAAAAAMPVTDTIKRVADGMVTTLVRSGLWAMQTPQGARIDLLEQAHTACQTEATDDMAMVEAIGVHPVLVPGEADNLKITTQEDLQRARLMAGGGETRTGFGYDVHAFSTDPNRPMFLGGVEFDDRPGLEGHSDADALLHAATDALLGAAALGDIGQHFQNTDPRWKNAPSLTFLVHAAKLLAEKGWHVINLDMTVLAERPKVMPKALEIRAKVAEALGVDMERVSVKATTHEGLGCIGRGEGIAALATATIRRD